MGRNIYFLNEFGVALNFKKCFRIESFEWQGRLVICLCTCIIQVQSRTKSEGQVIMFINNNILMVFGYIHISTSLFLNSNYFYFIALKMMSKNLLHFIL